MRAVGTERAISCVRSDHCHVGHAVANLKSVHAAADLINFSNHVIASKRPPIFNISHVEEQAGWSVAVSSPTRTWPSTKRRSKGQDGEKANAAMWRVPLGASARSFECCWCQELGKLLGR
jgi:hypothetical protein